MTTIRFSLPATAEVSLDVYDILGRKIENLFSSDLRAGEHSVVWNAEDLASGIYFYMLKTDDFSETRSCLLLK